MIFLDENSNNHKIVLYIDTKLLFKKIKYFMIY